MTLCSKLGVAFLALIHLQCYATPDSQLGRAETQRKQHWTSSWYSPIDTSGPALPPQSIRQWLRLSLGGPSLRLHFSNQFGQTPLVIDSVFVASGRERTRDNKRQAQQVRFSGRDTVTLGPGEQITSDIIQFKTSALEEIEISFFLPLGASNTSLHNASMANALLIPDLNLTREARWDNAKQDDTRYFLSEVEVLGQTSSKAIVALGDSLTDGVGIENDHYDRWTDFLAQRLQQNSKTHRVAVLNAGIAGNRFMRDAKAPFIGTAGINRFNHDVLQRAGITAVIVSIGTNDISANSAFKESDQVVSFEELIDGYRQLIKLAHERGIRIFAATIKPRGGAGGILPHTPEAEALRVRVNQWMRESKEFDAVIDFDRMLRDPARPDRLLPRYDSGDHTHPNAEGYRVMAQGIDLRLFN